MASKVKLGKPENVERFKQISLNDIQVYIHEKLMPANEGITVKVILSRYLFWNKLEVHDMKNVFILQNN